jgi:hypothetical protein
VALEQLDDDGMDISRPWETIRECIKASAAEGLGHYVLKQHKPWFDDKCSKLLDQMKQENCDAESKSNKWR